MNNWLDTTLMKMITNYTMSNAYIKKGAMMMLYELYLQYNPNNIKIN